MGKHTHSGKLSLALLFLCIFAFWWGIAVLAQNNNTIVATASTQPVSQPIAGPVGVYVSTTKNVYTYSGSVLIAPCQQLGEGVAVHGKNPTHVTILLTVTKVPIACAEAAGGSDTEPFYVSVGFAPGTKTILDGVMVNGTSVSTTIYY